MTATISASLPDASSSLGAFEIGALLMIFSFGIVTLQTYNYYHRYPSDSFPLKIFVAVVWLLGVGHTILVAAGLYDVTVKQFGQPSAETLDPLPTSIGWSIALGTVLTSLVQGFFAYRIHVLSKKLYLPLICWSSSFAYLVGCIAAASLAIIKGLSFPVYGKRYGWLISSIFAVGAFVDLTIAAGMCYYLKRERALAIPRTVKSLDQLIVYSIETGIVTSLSAMAVLICFKAMPDNVVWFGVYMSFGEMFPNALMASLNSRRDRSETDDTVISTFRAPYVGNATGPEPTTLQKKHYSRITFPRAILTSDIIIEIRGATDANEDFSIASSNDEGKHSGAVALPLPTVD
ncbi:hypothetical protein BV22DRAFT_1128072 [Leucogyrophana mollusca]|uniref:Uncharacterized protein n=1 Tax=Leucogyrophana mollusca TaxID=85980 RepID=A0ACB8BL33_9AGAM|nr:hypothetical protein BV22DRAFT_1128072 [Leucogyrophana mollusca]